MKNHSIEDLLQILQNSVEEITSSKSYGHYLKVMSRFPSYSIRNTLLIYAQKPDATLVAGFQTWKKTFGRHVRKGEKGIRILAPYTYQVSTEENGLCARETRTGFRSISVFDISQTEGRPLPAGLALPRELQGSCPLFVQALPVMEKLTGYEIEKADLPDDTRGSCSYSDQKILISSSVEEKHAFKTLIHESAHALLHHPVSEDLSPFEQMVLTRQDLREVEAESVSYVVCTSLGIDCSDYSLSYVAHWKQQQTFFQESLERIALTSRQILSELDGIKKA